LTNDSQTCKPQKPTHANTRLEVPSSLESVPGS
jgi:hypothetical protein